MISNSVPTRSLVSAVGLRHLSRLSSWSFVLVILVADGRRLVALPCRSISLPQRLQHDVAEPPRRDSPPRWQAVPEGPSGGLNPFPNAAPRAPASNLSFQMRIVEPKYNAK